MDYKGKPSRELPSDASLPDKLNAFYARYEASNTEPCLRAPAVPDDCVITLSIANVSKTFLSKLMFTRLQGQTDYQDAYSEQALTSWQGLHCHFQPLPGPVCNTYMFQADHHSPCAKDAKVICLNDYRP
jgi:hypothetical protein